MCHLLGLIVSVILFVAPVSDLILVTLPTLFPSHHKLNRVWDREMRHAGKAP